MINLAEFSQKLNIAIETARLAGKKRAYIFKTNDFSMLHIEKLQKKLVDPDDIQLPQKNQNTISLFSAWYYTDESCIEKGLINQQHIIDCFKQNSLIKQVYDMLVKLKFKPRIDVFLKTDFQKAALVEAGKLPLNTKISFPLLFISVTVYKSRVKKIC